MSSPGKGGRGKEAPYSTTHYRIPKPIKASVERFAAAYRILSFDGDSEGCRNLIKSVDDATASLGEAEDEIKRLKLELALAKTRIEVLENERELIITNLVPAYGLGSRDGVKIRGAIAIAIPEVKERHELLKNSEQKSKK
jgi:hypothetical protein